MPTSTATATTPPTLKKVPWLAEILDVSLPRVYAMISEGVIPDRCVLRIGRSIRLQEDETISWLRGGRHD